MIQATAAKQDPAAPFFRPRRLAHANLFVSDYEKAADFYSRVAGFEEVYRQPDNRAAFHSNGNTYHDLGLTDVRSKYAPANQKPDLFHLAFELENEADLVEGYRRSTQAGVKYAYVQDHDVVHSLYTYDPDENMVEFYADTVKDWRSARRGIIVGPKPEWIPGVTNPPSADRNYSVDPEIRIVKDAVFHPRKITSVGLVTRNYEPMIEFYTGFAGFVLIAGGRSSPYAVLQGTAGTGDITLYRPRPGLKAGMHHMSFQLRDEAELVRSVAALSRCGIRLQHDVDHPVRRSVGIFDPDGLRLHFCVERDWSSKALAKVDAESDLFVL